MTRDVAITAIAHPTPAFFPFLLQTKHLSKSTLAWRLGGPCVALGWRLGGPRVAHSQTQSQQAEGRKREAVRRTIAALQIVIVSERRSREPNDPERRSLPIPVAECYLLFFKDLFPLTP
jgi:hypothetical protein